MSTEKIMALVYQIRQQHPNNPFPAMSQCVSDGCEVGVVGAGKCVQCLQSELSLVVGPYLAQEFCLATREACECLRAMLEVEI